MKRIALLLLLLLCSPVVASAQLAMIRAQTEETPGTTYSITDGLLTADVGAGAHQAHIRWDVPDVADMPDLKGFQISFGTATGVYDLLTNKDITTTIQPGANEVLVTGLDTTTNYYWRVRAIDSEGNLGSWCAEQTCTSAAAWSAPSSPTDVDQSDFPLTLSGNMRLSENIAVANGVALTLASNASLDFNGHTITGGTSGASFGVVYSSSAITNCRLYDSTATTPGTGGGIICGSQADCRGIYFSTALGSGNVIRDIFIRYAGLTTFCVEAYDGESLGGLRMFNVMFDMDGGDDDGYSLQAGGFQYIKDAYIYGCLCDMDTDDARSYVFSNTKGYAYIWGNDANIRYNADITTGNHGFYVTRHDGDAYVHDNDVVVIASATRNFFADGTTGINVRCNWNTVDLSGSVDYPFCTAFDVRNDDMSVHVTKNVAYGFNTVENGENPLVYTAFRFTGEPWEGEGTNTTWEVAYDYHNTVNGISTTRGAMVLNKGHTNCYHWGNTYNCADGYTGLVLGWGTEGNPVADNDEYFNDLTFNGGAQPFVDGPGSSLSNLNWFVNNSAWTTGGDADDDSRITYSGSWQGYNPNTDSIPTPTGMAQVTGVH